jgi:hypothetical protein
LKAADNTGMPGGRIVKQTSFVWKVSELAGVKIIVTTAKQLYVRQNHDLNKRHSGDSEVKLETL